MCKPIVQLLDAIHKYTLLLRLPDRPPELGLQCSLMPKNDDIQE
jgi:hypothetical protein